MNLLGAIAYDPAVAVSKATSALLAMTAVDTANLRLAITVPSHGKVRFRLQCTLTGATTVPAILLGVLNGATVVGRVTPNDFPGTVSATTQTICVVAEFIASGLAAGAANFDAAYAVQVIVASTNIKYGGPNTNAGANAWGAFVFEAWDPQPLQTNGQLVVDANGRVDVSKVTGTAQTARDLGAQLDAAVSTRLAPTVAGRTLDVAATGEAGLDFDNIHDASGAHTLTNITVPSVTTLTTYTGNTPQTGDSFARIGAAGVGLTNLGDARIAHLDADVSTRSTYAGGAVASVTAAVTVGTNNDKTGYGLSAAAVQAIWDALTSALTTAGSIGKKLADWVIGTTQTGDSFARIGAAGVGLTNLGDARIAHLDADVSTRSTYAGADTAGTTTLLGRLTATRAGLLDHLDTDISSRLATAGYTAPDNASIAAVKVQTDKFVFTVANKVDANTLAVAGTAQTARDLGAQLDAAISTRLATSDYTAPDNAGVAAIKAKTDQMVFTAANKLDANVRMVNSVAVTGAGTSASPWGA